jgi:hypothetical protein
MDAMSGHVTTLIELPGSASYITDESMALKTMVVNVGISLLFSIHTTTFATSGMAKLP